MAKQTTGSGDEMPRPRPIASDSLPPSRRRRKNYTYENLVLALEELKKGKCSIRHCMRVYGVPESTLRSRISRPDPVGDCRMGRGPILTTAEEAELERWVLEKARQGRPYHSVDLRLAAKRLLDRRTDRPMAAPSTGNNLLGKHWLGGFLQRHPSIRRPRGSSKLIEAPPEAEREGEGGGSSNNGSQEGVLEQTASVSERVIALSVLESLMLRRSLLTYQKVYSLGISLPTDELYNIWKELKETSQPLPRPSDSTEERRVGDGTNVGEVRQVANVGRPVWRKMDYRQKQARLREMRANRMAFFGKTGQKRLSDSTEEQQDGGGANVEEAQPAQNVGRRKMTSKGLAYRKNQARLREMRENRMAFLGKTGRKRGRGAKRRGGASRRGGTRQAASGEGVTRGAISSGRGTRGTTTRGRATRGRGRTPAEETTEEGQGTVADGDSVPTETDSGMTVIPAIHSTSQAVSGEREAATGDVVVIVQESTGDCQALIPSDWGTVLAKMGSGVEVIPQIGAGGVVVPEREPQVISVVQGNGESSTPGQGLGVTPATNGGPVGGNAFMDQGREGVAAASVTCGSCNAILAHGDLMQWSTVDDVHCERCLAVNSVIDGAADL